MAILAQQGYTDKNGEQTLHDLCQTHSQTLKRNPVHKHLAAVVRSGLIIELSTRLKESIAETLFRDVLKALETTATKRRKISFALGSDC